MGSIGTNPSSKAEVRVATSDGKAYYRITSFLKSVGIRYTDMILSESRFVDADLSSLAASRFSVASTADMRLIITTRKERLLLVEKNVLCIEDLGEDSGLAKEKLYSALYPLRESDDFIIGIDPGERTGLVAFINHREVESRVMPSIDETVERVSKLLDNAHPIRKTIRIGFGNRKVAIQIAGMLDEKYKGAIRIQLVNESGTSTLSSRKAHEKRSGTRDQRAAKLIAFREGFEYGPATQLSR